MINRKTMTIIAIMICIMAFAYTRMSKTHEQPIQNAQTVTLMGMDNVKLVETPSAQNYIINGNNNATDKADKDLFAAN